MHDGVRRLSLLLIIISASAILTFLIRGRGPEYGLFHLLRGETAPALAADGAHTWARESAVRSGQTPNLSQLSEEQTAMARAVMPSVVSVSTSRRVVAPRALGSVERLLPNAAESAALAEPGFGSGVIVSEEGLVITAHHVVSGVDEIQVYLHDGQPFRGRVRGFDPVADIALVELEHSGRRFPPLRFSSQEARQGEIVFAAGSPFGQHGTLTQGIVSSARPRRLFDGSPAWLQTNTVINPGSSGGPLLNTRGDIVGINVAIYRAQRDVHVWQGFGLAIPAGDVREAIDVILKRGTPRRGYLGIYADVVDPRLAAELGLANITGAFITGTLPDSPAEKAGLRAHDVIVRYNGEPVRDPDDLVRRIHSAKLDDAVNLTVVRDRREIEVAATIVAAAPAKTTSELGAAVWTRAGLRARDLSTDEKVRAQLDPLAPALLVLEVRENSRAFGFLAKDDIILASEGEGVTSHAFFSRLLASPAEELRLRVRSASDGAVREVKLPSEK